MKCLVFFGHQDRLWRTTSGPRRTSSFPDRGHKHKHYGFCPASPEISLVIWEFTTGLIHSSLGEKPQQRLIALTCSSLPAPDTTAPWPFAAARQNSTLRSSGPRAAGLSPRCRTGGTWPRAPRATRRIAGWGQPRPLPLCWLAR